MIMKLLSILLLIIPCLVLARDHPERYYQDIQCAKVGGQSEVVLPDGTRADCVTTYAAVEIDFADKWAEAGYQSRHYARLLGKFPVIWLIMESQKDCKYLLRLMPLADQDGIKVEQIGAYRCDTPL